MQRLEQISHQLTPNCTSGPTTISLVKGKCPNDVVICAAYRTPLCKAKKGGLRDTAPEILLSHVMRHVLQTTKCDPKLVEDTMVGNCLQPGAGALVSRAAQLMAGLPDTTSIAAINRQCSSGLEACNIIASKIKAGVIDIGMGCGVESMSLFDMNSMVDAGKLSDELFEDVRARNCLQSMGQTSENVCEKYGLKRADLDAFAVASHVKAAKAQKEGLFKEEIVPIKVKVKEESGAVKEVLIDKDDGIRGDTTVEGLAKLKPAFKKDGITTAGNSSQVTDGAAAVLLARRSVAEKHGLPIIGRFVSYAVVGVPPEIMGVGPGYAIPAALKKAGLTKDDIDIYEINEAFSSQALWSINHIGIDIKKVNPKGGAIALGHPLGCTGARQFSTLLTELKRTGKTYGVISMCIGTGMGAAGVIARE